MPQRAWNSKRERQYEHVKEGLEERGRPEDEAEEIAAQDRQQGAGTQRRGEAGQPHLDRGHLLRAPRRDAVAPGPRWENPGPAL
jgi:hypothetical protein